MTEFNNLDIVPEGIVIFTDNGEICFRNAKAKLLLSDSVSNINDLFIENHLASLFEYDEYEGDIRTKDNREFMFSLKRHEDKKVLTLKDITLISEFERDKELQRALQSHEKSSSERLKVFTDLAHELNNPLMILNGSIYMLKKLYGKEGKEEKITGLFKTCDEILARIEKALNNKKETIKYNFSTDSEEMNLYDFLLGIVDFLEDEVRINSVSIHIDRSLDIDVNYQADILRFTFIELIANSIFFMNKAGVSSKSIKIRAEVSDKELAILYEDAGAPIVVDDYTQLFEPFYTTKLKEEGLGTGLCQIKNLLNINNANIEYDVASKNAAFKIIIKRD